MATHRAPAFDLMDDEADQIGREEVDALYAIVRVGVGIASIAAAALSIILVRFRALPFRVGLIWSVYIAICAATHVGLRTLRNRAPRRHLAWRFWGGAFTAISLCEGLGWGWASVMLAKHDTTDAKFLVLLATQAVAAGSIPAFGRYLPAFLALFVPTTSFYLFANVFAGDPLEWASGLLMILYIGAMIPLGVSSNRQFRQVIRLRLQTDRLVDELRAQKAVAERANLAKSTFLAAASHDLRQPVHALGLFVGALKTFDMPPDALRLVEQIDLSTQAMDGLFAALLDISRLDAGVVEVHNCAFAIDSVLARICSDYDVEAKAKSLGFTYRPSRAVVSSDPILIERILRNLIANALRYTEKGGVLIGCRRQGARLRIQVWDTGIGIPLDQQESVFQEYFQLGNLERDRQKGLGLGLAIVRRLTLLLGVPMRVRSVPGRGSRFEIDLPLVASMPSAQPPFVATRLAQLESRLIVVIDDEAPIRAAMFSVLSRWGHTVVVAGSGREAIETLADLTRRPDLIICDLRLRAGEMGTDVIEALRSEYNEPIPAILVTGDTAPDRLAEARASGLLLLHKPVSNGRLRAALVNVIAAGTPTESDV